MTPTPADYDDMHHALGRPPAAGVTARTYYRNHYCCEAGGDTARRFEQLGWWRLCRHINDGRDAVYEVNDAGRAALVEWMERRDADKT